MDAAAPLFLNSLHIFVASFTEESLPGVLFPPPSAHHTGDYKRKTAPPKVRVSRILRARFSNPGGWARPPPSLPTHGHSLLHTHCTYFPASFSRRPVLCEMTPFPSTLPGLGWAEPERASWASRTCSGKKRESDCFGLQWKLSAHLCGPAPCWWEKEAEPEPLLGRDTSNNTVPLLTLPPICYLFPTASFYVFIFLMILFCLFSFPFLFF